MQKLYASIRVELPDDPTVAAVRHAIVAKAWAEFVSEIHADVTDADAVQMSLTMDEARAPRRSRKPASHAASLVVGNISMPNPDNAA
jgi:hypothetical protein